MQSADLYMSEEALNDGARLDIGGGQWLRVLYLYSDAAATRMDAIDRERDGDVIDLKRAALVTAWSLDDECTGEAVAKLCERNPRIRKLIDQRTMDSASFFGSAPTD